MKTTLTVYSDPQAQGLTGFLHALGMNLNRDVVLLPVSALPAPDPQRRQALKVERLEIIDSIGLAQHDLERLQYGDVAADAGRENGLKADLDALRTRLKAIDTVLGTVEGGADNA